MLRKKSDRLLTGITRTVTNMVCTKRSTPSRISCHKHQALRSSFRQRNLIEMFAAVPLQLCACWGPICMPRNWGEEWGQGQVLLWETWKAHLNSLTATWSQTGDWKLEHQFSQRDRARIGWLAVPYVWYIYTAKTQVHSVRWIRRGKQGFLVKCPS